jgi:hypothetical protein
MTQRVQFLSLSQLGFDLHPLSRLFDDLVVGHLQFLVRRPQFFVGGFQRKKGAAPKKIG